MPASSSPALDLTMRVAEARRAHGRSVPRAVWVGLALAVGLVWGIGLWPTLAALCGLAALGSYASAVRRARASPSWPYELAIVTESRLHRDTTSGTDSDDLSPVFRPVALLEYEVGGKIYLGTTLEFVDGTRDRAAAEHALATTWAEGNTVGIRADPSDPFRFTLADADPEAVAGKQAWLVLVGLAFLGGAVMLYLS